MIAIGAIAPDFTLPRDGGTSLTLSALRPGKVVVYFYPKDGRGRPHLRRLWHLGREKHVWQNLYGG